MTSFLFKTAEYIHQQYAGNTRDVLIVLPNKRGSLFLKRNLAKIYNKTIWLPRIISAEEFIAELSGLQSIDNITLTALLYDSYLEVLKEKAEPFDSFIKWSNMLLQDFNEIDRYLVNAAAVYKNLAEIKEIENWSLAEEKKTEMQSNYLQFMSAIGDVYKVFVKKLLDKKLSYQGLAYRIAVENVKSGLTSMPQNDILFAGFNALNHAEEILFRYFIEEKGAAVLWDADRYYLENPLHEAGLFLRRHFSKDFFRSQNFIGNDLSDQAKNISVIGAPQNMAQVATAASVLGKWIHSGISTDKTAIILCDESLLFPLLNVLPSETGAVNVSLEYPLRQSTLYDLSEQLINLHINKKKNTSQGAVYYKDLLRVLQNPYFNTLFAADFAINKITRRIAENNISYFSLSTLRKLFGEQYDRVAFLFDNWNAVAEAVSGLKKLATALLETFAEKKTKSSELDKEFAFEYSKLINRLEDVCREVNYINDLKTLRRILQQLVAGSSVPFYGEPLKGLQVMGVLETRTLDFENVILISVNENILPSGKSANTFLPYDLKKYFKLPVYQDKDAIYAYHFYRLLQRAKNIALIYNTETDTLGKGEKSRFITQLLHELPEQNNQLSIEEYVAIPEPAAQEAVAPIIIEKTAELIERTKQKAFSPDKPGFSPSLLNTYKACNLRFYFNYLAKIKEAEEVEETVEAGTFGTILHSVLETAYTPFLDRFLLPGDFEKIYPSLESLTEQAFRNEYAESEFRTGKNFLAFHTIRSYAENLIRSDEKFVRELNSRNNSLKITGLETKLEYVLQIESAGEIVPVKISGTADRIDQSAGQLRIVDYKSSVSDANDKFVFNNFGELFSDKKYSKAFQLFMYSWLAWRTGLAPAGNIKSCIIPFRGNKKSEYYLEQNGRPLQLTEELLIEFEANLVTIILEMLDGKVPFAQTPEEDVCLWCAYANICGRNSE